jgi:hypothetical protein
MRELGVIKFSQMPFAAYLGLLSASMLSRKYHSYATSRRVGFQQRIAKRALDVDKKGWA